MKKFSKLITESKKELWTKHPLVNPVDWDEIFKPLIEHINANLKSKVPSPGEGIFSINTKGALDDLIDAITEDYQEYYANIVADGSEESFFDAYNIDVECNQLTDCLQSLMDNAEAEPIDLNWNGGYWHMRLEKFTYKDTDELIEDILDVHSKLKMFSANHKISLHSQKADFRIHLKTEILNSFTDEQIKKGIRNLLELPGQDPKLWINGLKSIDIFIYNKATVQVGDLD